MALFIDILGHVFRITFKPYRNHNNQKNKETLSGLYKYANKDWLHEIPTDCQDGRSDRITSSEDTLEKQSYGTVHKNQGTWGLPNAQQS